MALRHPLKQFRRLRQACAHGAGFRPHPGQVGRCAALEVAQGVEGVTLGAERLPGHLAHHQDSPIPLAHLDGGVRHGVVELLFEGEGRGEAAARVAEGRRDPGRLLLAELGDGESEFVLHLRDVVVEAHEGDVRALRQVIRGTARHRRASAAPPPPREDAEAHDDGHSENDADRSDGGRCGSDEGVRSGRAGVDRHAEGGHTEYPTTHGSHETPRVVPDIPADAA